MLFMDARTVRRYGKVSKNHTKRCYKCGYPNKREGCRFQGCNEVIHCACALTQENNSKELIVLNH